MRQRHADTSGWVFQSATFASNMHRHFESTLAAQYWGWFFLLEFLFPAMWCYVCKNYFWKNTVCFKCLWLFMCSYMCVSKGVYVCIELKEWEVFWLPLIPLSNFLWFNNHTFLLSYIETHESYVEKCIKSSDKQMQKSENFFFFIIYFVK